MNILHMLLSLSSFVYTVLGMSCGIDKSPNSEVYEGPARIETYPWLGILYYPYNRKRFTTAVVLVTRQIVLGSAAEIDKLPKADFRARARVVIGHNCSGPDIGIRDYTYHPDFNRDTFSALAMVQLETDHVTMDCKRSKVRIHKMNYVSPEDCKNYYRRTGLDVDTMWPSHTACAKSTTGGRCVWRSGAILVVKSYNRWRLLGFGVYGPGCEAPARFLDYGMYHPWVRRSVERIGRPAITTLATNHVVLRRTLNSVQRFGPCDLEESKPELFTDFTKINHKRGRYRYNLTIVADVDYSCVIFKANHENREQGTNKPQIRLRRWCAGSTGMCFGFGFMEIQFYVELTFTWHVSFQVMAYGKEARILDPKKALKWRNSFKPSAPIDSYSDTKRKYAPLLADNEFPWYVQT